jgi:uncharacterized FlaG/YvyC family protein
MSDNFLPSMSRIELDLSASAQVSQPQSTQGPQAGANNTRGTEEAAAPRSESGQRANDPKVDVKEGKQPNPFNDISLQFKVDPKTEKVTILILDRASDKVVRSIPPEDIDKMSPGEIMQLFV